MENANYVFTGWVMTGAADRVSYAPRGTQPR